MLIVRLLSPQDHVFWERHDRISLQLMEGGLSAHLINLVPLFELGVRTSALLALLKL